MKHQHIYIFIISILTSISIYSQEKDTLKIKTNYGLRVGIDISKPIISVIEDNHTGFEIVTDFRFSNRFYAAVEFGFSDKTTQEDYLNFSTKGTFIKAGANYNAYKNWIGMNNEIYVGVRYGISSFSQTLNSYIPNSYGTYFEAEEVSPNTEFSNLTASWLEFVFGLKVETFKNLFLGTSVSYNKMMATKEPENFKNLFVPGFNRVFSNDAGIDFTYTVSYLIPIFNKAK